MPIHERTFSNEAELEDWVKANIGLFTPSTVLLDGFRIKTSSGKGGIPDGFVFDFPGRQWFAIECELLSHGVWPHIAEQLTRFTVALQTDDSLMTIRDQLFDHIIRSESVNECCESLQVVHVLLHAEIERFLTSVNPGILVFIDDINRDLTDFLEALSIPTKVFRIKKLTIDGKLEFFSPIRILQSLNLMQSIIVTTRFLI